MRTNAQAQQFFSIRPFKQIMSQRGLVKGNENHVTQLKEGPGGCREGYLGMLTYFPGNNQAADWCALQAAHPWLSQSTRSAFICGGKSSLLTTMQVF